MKYVHGISELRNDHHPVFSVDVDSNLERAGSNGGHWSPVARFKSLLDKVQLAPGHAPSSVRELAEVIERRATPEERLLERGTRVVKTIHENI